MRITPATELEFRCNKLQALMAEVGLDAVGFELPDATALA